ncbi:hypothetical protein MmTuc01_1960 [Methanosarcina mazei Tuc01]|uniref:Uncharacterized protein n=1 Tax=Methanosarcina mazei Tuc01 TaxID=1236903 RepID=M1Q4P1_METMZ|nr:hypothetical protein MmTuc01_1960 [Methanosarcina mazei Tuc01]
MKSEILNMEEIHCKSLSVEATLTDITYLRKLAGTDMHGKYMI